MELFSSGNRLMNHETTVVSESLLSNAITNPSVGVMDFGNVVVRRDYQTYDKVKIISGGGTGHQPAYAGYVGPGMLTAAVHGDVFNAPSAKLILRTIKEVALKQPNAGVFLIIRRSRGASLNFGLALERAVNDGIRTKMLIVDDDCSIKPSSREQQGLCGLVLFYKIAGAMAEEEKSLDEIYKFCEKVHKQMSSVLLCLRPCTSPTTKSCICERTKAENEYEIGTGLHGERGTKRARLTTLKDTCKDLLDELTNGDSPKPFVSRPDQPVAVVINNLGTVSRLEESLFVHEFVKQLLEKEVMLNRLYCGSFYSSLDMAAISVTVLQDSNDEIERLLDAPCQATAWNNQICSKNVTLDLLKRLPATVDKFARRTPTLKGPKINDYQANVLYLVTQFACDALISCERQLNVMDGESGDADTGSKMRQGAEAILRELGLKRLKTTHPFTFLEYLSRLLEAVMAGTLGCIYSVFFEAAAKPFANLAEDQSVDVKLWLAALENATNTIQRYTNAEAGSKTLYDAFHACLTTAKRALAQSKYPLEAFGEAVSAAEDAAQNTRQADRRYPDPGAHAAGIWMRAVYEGVKLRCSDY